MNYIDIHNNFLTVKTYDSEVQEVIEAIKSYILRHECERMCVDISILNLMDATRTSVLCSTYHFAKYPHGNMKWIVKDLQTKLTIKPMALKNVEITEQKAIIPDFILPQKETLSAIR